MRFLVTGAAGFIGSHLSMRLCAAGHAVIGVDNFISGRRSNRELLEQYDHFAFLEHDIVEPFEVDAPLDGVFHFACPASPIDFKPHALEILRVCSEGTRNVLQIALAHGVVFVHASTSECYGDPLEHPQRESYWGNVNCIGERSPYDEGKRFAEALVMAYHRRHQLSIAIGRIFNTHGPRMRAADGRVLPNFIRQALAGEPLTVYGDGSQTRSFCYVDDMVNAFLRLQQCAVPSPINVGNEDEVTIAQVAREIIELCDSRSDIRFLPLPNDDPKVRRPDLTLARHKLDWEPQTPRLEGFRRTVEYFRTQH